jgi:hypothetical protein
MGKRVKKILYRTTDGDPQESWYYIVDPDDLLEAAYLVDAYSIYKVCNSGDKTCLDLNKLAEEAYNDLFEEYDGEYAIYGDDVIERINEKFNMKLELEYCPDFLIIDEEDILWDEEEMEFSESKSFYTVVVYRFWDYRMHTWVYEIVDETIEISDCIEYVCLDKIENANRTSFCTGGIGNHSYVAYLSKNQYLIKETSDWEYTRTMSKIVNKKELINYLKDKNRDVNYYFKLIHS